MSSSNSCTRSSANDCLSSSSSSTSTSNTTTTDRTRTMSLSSSSTETTQQLTLSLSSPCTSMTTTTMKASSPNDMFVKKPSLEEEQQSPKGFLDTISTTNQFIVLTLCMFFFFGIHNVLQEAMMSLPGFNYGVMLGYMEVIGVTVCSFFERTFMSNERGRIAPLKAYPLLTLCLLGSSALSNWALDYINFPTKVVFRSCKLIPTMIIATLINKRTFTRMEYICAGAISLGLIMFAAADWKLTPSFNPIGIVLVSCSVVADSVLPNAQERLFTYHGASRLEVTLYTNFFTLVAMTGITLASGDLMGIIKHASSDPTLAMYMIIFTAISYAAISTYMQIVKRFGGVAAVLLATARKGMTLVLSFLLFPKAFSWYYVMGAIMVLGGLLIVSLNKHKQRAMDDASSKTKAAAVAATTTQSDDKVSLLSSSRGKITSSTNDSDTESSDEEEDIELGKEPQRSASTFQR